MICNAILTSIFSSINIFFLYIIFLFLYQIHFCQITFKTIKTLLTTINWEISVTMCINCLCDHIFIFSPTVRHWCITLIDGIWQKMIDDKNDSNHLILAIRRWFSLIILCSLFPMKYSLYLLISFYVRIFIVFKNSGFKQNQ